MKHPPLRLQFRPLQIFWLALFVLANQSAFAATVTRGPYLQMGGPNSVVVRWRTDVATDSRVRFGASPSSLTSAADVSTSTTEHTVTVSGLSPDSQYFYSVGTTGQTLAGGDSTYYWITFPSVGTPAPTRIWVLGDSGTANANAAAVSTAYLNATGSRHTDFWLMLGDNAYNNGTDADYQTAVFNLYPTMLRKSVLFPTLGNHDTAQATQFVDTYPYFSIFTLPKNAEVGGVASGTEHYYSFDFGNLHFICLDSMTANRAANGPMANWLRSDLAATTQDWIIAFWHHPPYTKGSHDSDTEVELIQMRENFNPILEAGGVDLVLTGHSHSYERSYLIDQHYGLSTSFSAGNLIDGGSGRTPNPYEKPDGPTAHAGAVYVVGGSSGQTSGGALNHPAMFASLNILGSVVLDFTTNRLDLQFLDSTGVVRDNFAMIKVSTANPPPAPTGVTATAGDNRVTLGWNAVPSASSYTVGRGTISGGPYTDLASSLTSPSFVDTTAANGTTYYYVVRAVNGVGSSPNSSQVSATPQATAAPAAPTALAAKASGKKKIGLTWTQSNSPNVQFNRVYRANISNGPYTLIATLSPTTSYNNTGLAPGQTYYYRVTAVGIGGLESAFSNEASATAR